MNVVYIYLQVGMLGAFMIFVSLMTFLCVARRDFDIMRRRPLVFVVELLVVALIPAIPVLFFVVSRGIPFEEALVWFYGLAIKFAVLHVVFQVSGFYTFLMEAVT